LSGGRFPENETVTDEPSLTDADVAGMVDACRPEWLLRR
jgi:hypothetical protein